MKKSQCKKDLWENPAATTKGNRNYPAPLGCLTALCPPNSKDSLDLPYSLGDRWMICAYWYSIDLGSRDQGAETLALLRANKRDALTFSVSEQWLINGQGSSPCSSTCPAPVLCLAPRRHSSTFWLDQAWICSLFLVGVTFQRLLAKKDVFRQTFCDHTTSSTYCYAGNQVLKTLHAPSLRSTTAQTPWNKTLAVP